jgi:predicted transcriptional regulator
MKEMRTTIELTDPQRAKLLELAAQRREKGFSRLIQEAVDRYLAEEASRSDRIRAALGLAGSLDDQAADAMEATAATLRKSWR